MIIEAKGLSKSFISGTTTIEVLKGVSFAVNDHEMVALMGVSGSGKSTLLHILGLINKPDSGKLIFMDREVNFNDKIGLAKLRNKNIGFVFQFYSLISELNVIENVMLPAMIGFNKKDEAAAVEMLNSVGIDSSMAFKMVYKLSGGEMQRVALARALINEPDIVIADEPTANLDKASSIDIVTAMRNINSLKKTTFIIATHNDTIADACDRVLTLNGGVISE